jgi:hypothetical protein
MMLELRGLCLDMAYFHWCHEVERLRPLRSFGLNVIIVGPAISVTRFLPKRRPSQRWFHAVHHKGANGAP